MSIRYGLYCQLIIFSTFIRLLQPYSSTAFTSAPAASNSFTQSAWPCIAARIRLVQPNSSAAFASAPAARVSRGASVSPLEKLPTIFPHQLVNCPYLFFFCIICVMIVPPHLRLWFFSQAETQRWSIFSVSIYPQNLRRVIICIAPNSSTRDHPRLSFRW